MGTLKAAINLSVDLNDKMDQKTALFHIGTLLDFIEMDYDYTDSPIKISNMISYEVCEDNINKLKVSPSEIVCGHCGKTYSTNDFEKIPMLGHIKREKGKLYMHDTGDFELCCDCGYRTTVGKIW